MNTESAMLTTNKNIPNNQQQHWNNIMHFLEKEDVEQLIDGFDLIRMSETEEGGLSKRFYEVAVRKSSIR